MKDVIGIIVLVVAAGAFLYMVSQMGDYVSARCPEGWVGAHSYGTGIGCVPSPETASKFNRMLDAQGERT